MTVFGHPYSFDVPDKLAGSATSQQLIRLRMPLWGNDRLDRESLQFFSGVTVRPNGFIIEIKNETVQILDQDRVGRVAKYRFES